MKRWLCFEHSAIFDGCRPFHWATFHNKIYSRANVPKRFGTRFVFLIKPFANANVKEPIRNYSYVFARCILIVCFALWLMYTLAVCTAIASLIT